MQTFTTCRIQKQFHHVTCLYSAISVQNMTLQVTLHVFITQCKFPSGAIIENVDVCEQHYGPCPISTCAVCQIFPGLGQTQQQRPGDHVEHVSEVLDPRDNTEVPRGEIGVVYFSKTKMNGSWRKRRDYVLCWTCKCKRPGTGEGGSFGRTTVIAVTAPFGLYHSPVISHITTCWASHLKGLPDPIPSFKGPRMRFYYHFRSGLKMWTQRALG